jgi:hypothetical protein
MTILLLEFMVFPSVLHARNAFRVLELAMENLPKSDFSHEINMKSPEISMIFPWKIPDRSH